MEFLDLPDDIIVDFIINKLPLSDISNLLKVNRKMKSIFHEIRSNPILYREYIDKHFPNIKEEFTITFHKSTERGFIVFPYEQRVYIGSNNNFHRIRLTENNVISMVHGNNIIYFLTDLGELYSISKNNVVIIEKDSYFIILDTDGINNFCISEDGKISLIVENMIYSLDSIVDDPWYIKQILRINTLYDNPKIQLITIYDEFINIEGDIEEIEKIPSPLFIIKDTLPIIIPNKNPTELIYLGTEITKELKIHVMKASPYNSQNVFLIDRDNDIYVYAHHNLKNKLKLLHDDVDISGSINISYIKGYSFFFIIIDENRDCYMCKKDPVSESIIVTKIILHETFVDIDYSEHEKRDIFNEEMKLKALKYETMSRLMGSKFFNMKNGLFDI